MAMISERPKYFEMWTRISGENPVIGSTKDLRNEVSVGICNRLLWFYNTNPNSSVLFFVILIQGRGSKARYCKS
jgi:hypothetical protein